MAGGGGERPVEGAAGKGEGASQAPGGRWLDPVLVAVAFYTTLKKISRVTVGKQTAGEGCRR